MVDAAQQKYANVAPETRKRMLAVRNRNTSPEMQVRRALHSLGYRFRLHRKELPGTPDIVLPGHKKIILVHGCFWHGHAYCKRSKLPTNNANVWREKIQGNKHRDEKNVRLLRQLGWDVMIIWECETHDPLTLSARLSNFLADQA